MTIRVQNINTLIIQYVYPFRGEAITGTSLKYEAFR